jgi:uncharacterized protein YbgA (DUF1722 family)/uncharacterized protein YbbK (DUF523 family)
VKKLGQKIVQFSFKPKLILSRCINKEFVRYNGGIVKDQFAEKLEKYVEYITVCPEVDIGMSVPRPSVLLAKINDKVKMIEPNTRFDYTEKMEKFSENFLNNLYDIDGFLLKAKSPSCGVKDTKLYKDDLKNSLGKTNGIFAEYAIKFFPYLPVEDEGRLRDFWIRQDFLTKIFAYADFRRLKNSIKSIKELIKFHQDYKYLLMLYSPSNQKKMGRLLANWDEHGLDVTLQRYEKLFQETFSKKQSLSHHFNVLQHILGHFSDLIKPKEKRHFNNLLAKLKENREYLKVVLEFTRNLIYRFEDPYLPTQKYLNPYPEELEQS